MGPRRITAVLATLAFGLLLATAGVAAASSFSSGGSDRGHDRSASSEPPRVKQPPVKQPPASVPPAYGDTDSPDDSGDSTGSPHDDGNPTQEPSAGGGVDALGGTPPAGVPQTPVTAPAAAVNGPAPAAAAAAPLVDAAQVDASGGETGAGTPNGIPTGDPATGATGVTGATAQADPPSASAPASASVPDPYSLAGIPQLSSLGQVVASVSDGPSTARELLTTPAGRSSMVLLGLVLAILLFLSVHRRLDRSDRKLASAQPGSDLARFR